MSNAKSQNYLDLGVSLWLDSLSREMLDSGWLTEKLQTWGLRGQTSNPTIFEGAVSSGSAYSEAIKKAASAGLDAETTCWQLMIEDVQRACDLFKDLYHSSEHQDGYVSLELDPTRANETEASIAQGHEIWKRVDRPNLMIKVPATEAGLPVVEELLYSGYNVNVTLLFSVDMYRKVMHRFLSALERRAQEGLKVSGIASVASFFISRVDSEVDARLQTLGTPEALNLCGKAAVANARVAYAAYQEVIANSERFQKLRSQGAQVQRPLWASTSTKNPEYPDTLYVDELVGPDCVNTVPEATLEAALDHGDPKVTLTSENEELARQQLKSLEKLGIDLQEITNVLLVEQGVGKFEQSFRSLLKVLESALSEQQAFSA